jgi:hypothetical protein
LRRKAAAAGSKAPARLSRLSGVSLERVASARVVGQLVELGFDVGGGHGLDQRAARQLGGVRGHGRDAEGGHGEAAQCTDDRGGQCAGVLGGEGLSAFQRGLKLLESFLHCGHARHPGGCRWGNPGQAGSRRRAARW